LFLQPLEVETATLAALEALKKAVLNLSQGALDLSMIIRLSKENYEFGEVTVDSDDILSVKCLENWVTETAVEGGKDDDASDEISYFLFGALAKSPPSQPVKVLEKAQVVLKPTKEKHFLGVKVDKSQDVEQQPIKIDECDIDMGEAPEIKTDNTSHVKEEEDEVSFVKENKVTTIG
jgi:hypothetical protein